MVRVLHVLNSMSRGGIQALLMDVYRKINHSEIQFDFLLEKKVDSDYIDEINKLGGKIFYIQPRREGILKNKKALENFFRNHPEYKIIHQHVSSLTNVAPLKVAQKFNIPVRVIHSHNTRQGGSFLHKYIHYINQLSVKSYATDYFACSALAAKWLYGKKQYNNGNYKIINNGIEIKRFVFNDQTRLAMREELGIKENTFVIGHVGRFAHQKNHEFLIDIFYDLHKKTPDSTLLLVGDGGLRAQIEQKAKKLGLDNNIIFTGIRSDIADVLQAMDVFVLPSHHEGLGIVVIESQAAGLHTIVSDTVPDDAYVTDLIEKEYLSSNSSIWANRILKYADEYERKDTYQDISDGGYDISRISEELQRWYQSKVITVDNER